MALKASELQTNLTKAGLWSLGLWCAWPTATEGEKLSLGTDWDLHLLITGKMRLLLPKPIPGLGRGGGALQLMQLPVWVPGPGPLQFS